MTILHGMNDMQGQSRTSFFFRYRYGIFIGLMMLLTIINSTIDIMEVDAAQYASISYEMSQTGNYLQVHHHGQDYLDKPPLLFWLASMSISIFGNSSVGYKLPAIILLWLAIWATFKFGQLWYDRKVGIVAALILGTMQAFHLMTNDVRTDGLLMSFVMLSVYFLSLYLKKGRLSSLIIGGICIGGAMLSKGPLGLMIPAIAIGGHLLINAEWKKILDWKWLLIIPVIALILAPMLYGLYYQFDMHPEKEVYGLKGPSGVEFYFWTQSFGRITGDIAWKNDTSVFYFFQTILWDFTPWILLFIPAIILKIRKVFQVKAERAQEEWISLFGFVIPFIALSFSNYKLPHYIFPLFPFAAIMTAGFLVRYADMFPVLFEKFYLFFLHLLVLLSILIVVWIFPGANILIFSLIIFFYGAFWWLRKFISEQSDKWLFSILMIGLLFQFVLSLHFYPRLLEFQSTSKAGIFIAKEKPEEIYWHKKHGDALDYYAGFYIPELSEQQSLSYKANSWIFTNEEGLRDLNGYRIIREYDDYPVTLLTPAFLNPDTRETKVKKVYLVEILP